MATVIKKAAAGTAKSPVGSTDKPLLEAIKLFQPVLEIRAVEDLKPNPRNAKIHPPKQIQQIAASITTFGWIVPIVVDEEGTILAGHGRFLAAQRLGLKTVSTLPVKHLTPERKRAFALADNRLAQLAPWDEEILKLELEELCALDLDFDVEVTGFGTGRPRPFVISS